SSFRRQLPWTVIAIWATLLFATRVPARLLWRETRPGDRIGAPSGVRSLAGPVIAPIAEESLTVVVVTTAECDKARLSLTSIANHPDQAFEALHAHSVPTLFLVGANQRVITRLPVPVNPDDLTAITRRLRAYSSHEETAA